MDAGSIGHTIERFFPPSTRFFSSPERLAIAGIDIPLSTQEKLTGEAYLAYLRSVVVTRNLPIRTFCRVVSAERVNGGGYRIGMSEPSGRSWQVEVKRVILASGGTDRPRQLGIPGEDLPHVHTSLGDPHRFFQRRVLVVGGRNSAIESALRCWRVHAEVAISYRGQDIHERVKYWLRPEVMSLVEEGRIKAFMPTQVREILPDHVVLEQLDGSGAINLPVDDVLLQIGYEQDGTLFQLFGISTEGEQASPVHNPDTLETDSPRCLCRRHRYRRHSAPLRRLYRDQPRPRAEDRGSPHRRTPASCGRGESLARGLTHVKRHFSPNCPTLQARPRRHSYRLRRRRRRMKPSSHILRALPFIGIPYLLFTLHQRQINASRGLRISMQFKGVCHRMRLWRIARGISNAPHAPWQHRTASAGFAAMTTEAAQRLAPCGVVS